jgi:hypothetical protein
LAEVIPSESIHPPLPVLLLSLLLRRQDHSSLLLLCLKLTAKVFTCTLFIFFIRCCFVLGIFVLVLDLIIFSLLKELPDELHEGSLIIDTIGQFLHLFNLPSSSIFLLKLVLLTDFLEMFHEQLNGLLK